MIIQVRREAILTTIMLPRSMVCSSVRGLEAIVGMISRAPRGSQQ